MFAQYPYLNLNDFNLDYILKAIKDMRYEVTNFVSINAIKYADPIQWDITRQYEKNTIVIDPLTGTAYISVAPVPVGVSLTRPEYWTVVFDLQSFVTKANQNLANNYEEQTTTTATMNTAAGAWVIWGDVLYKALVTITAGDAYVVGSNIQRITIEDVINAIAQDIADEVQARQNAIGDLNDLTTTDKSNIVNAINENTQAIADEVQARQDADGDLSQLTTTDKDNLVDAINEVNSTGGGAIALIGDLNDLTTTDKSNVVNAMNEINGEVTDLINSKIYVNVKDYGATGDGVTDDTSAINDALAVVNAAGGVLFFPNGRYIISAPIVLNVNGTTIKGATSQGVYIVQTNNVPAIYCGDSANTIRNLRVENLAVQSTATSPTTANCGIVFEKAVNGTIDNVIVNNFKVGVRISESGNGFFSNIGVISSHAGAIGFDVGNRSVSDAFTNVWAGFNSNAAEDGIGFLMINGNIADVYINYLDVANGAYGLRVDGGSTAPDVPADIRFTNIVCDGQRVNGIYISNMPANGNIVINGGWINPLKNSTSSCVSIVDSNNIAISNLVLQQVDASAPVTGGVVGSNVFNLSLINCNFINLKFAISVATIDELKMLGNTMQLYANNTSGTPACYLTNATRTIINENHFNDYTYSVSIASGDKAIIKNNITHGSISAPLTTVVIADNLTS